MTISFLSVLIGFAIAMILVWVLRSKFGFMAQSSSDYAEQGKEFDIREQLKGKLICEGVIYGPTGRVNTRFVANMNAKWNGNEGHMTEEFKYDTGGSLDREWTLRVNDDGSFDATAPDIIGTGKGQQSGSGVKLKYAIKLPDSAGGHVLDTTDWMYLMENGSIINRSQMRKFGIKVGELVATMRKAA